MSENHTSPSSDSSTTTSEGIARDTFLWRRKSLSFATLSISTAIWVVMEVYGFNFTTLASYVAMLVVAGMFFWGLMHRLLGKDTPKLSWLEISERAVIETANTIRAWAEECIRWMFRVGAEGDWLTFVGAVVALWCIAIVGRYFDLLTLLYICAISGLTVVPLAIRFQGKIKVLNDEMMARCRRLYETASRNLAWTKSGVEGKKEKKTE